MTDITFDGVSLLAAVPQAVVTAIKRGLLGDRRDTWTDVPGRAGSWLFPEQPGDRTITLGLSLRSARRAALAALATWADTSTAAALVIGDEPDRYWLAKLSNPGDPVEVIDWAKVSLEFRAGPYALATAVSTATWTATDGTPHTLTLPDDVEAYPVFEVTAATATASFTLTVGATTLVYGTAQTAGATVTVSSVAYMVTTGPNADTDLVGYFDTADVSMAAVSGDFPVLAPGANSVTIDTPAGQSATVTVTWRRRYRG
jgi:predicted phage tail component-like protein